MPMCSGSETRGFANMASLGRANSIVLFTQRYVMSFPEVSSVHKIDSVSLKDREIYHKEEHASKSDTVDYINRK